MNINVLTRPFFNSVALGLWVGAIACGGSPPAPAPSPEPVAADPITAETAPPPGPPAPPADAFLALLAPDQMAQLRTLGVPVIIPTAIPDGFGVAQVSLVGSNDRDQGYSIWYQHPNNRCFVVEYTAGGVGGTPTTEYRLPLNPPLFPDIDYGLNYGAFVDPDLRSQFPEPDLVSDWLEYGGGFYRLAGAAYINDRQSPEPPCQDVTPEEALTIIESFTEATDEIIGDG